MIYEIKYICNLIGTYAKNYVFQKQTINLKCLTIHNIEDVSCVLTIYNAKQKPTLFYFFMEHN